MVFSTRAFQRGLFAAVLLASAGAALSPALAQSQSLSDAKCSDAMKLEPDDQRMLLVWLAGYFAGASQSPMIDPAAIRNARQALAELCLKAPETRLLAPESRAAILGLPQRP